MKIGVVALTVLFFLAACCLPALEFKHSDRGTDIWTGLETLVAGWLGPLVGMFAWYANILLVLAVVFFLLNRARAAVILSGAALLLAAQTFQLFSQTIPADEGNVGKLDLQALGIGFYLWIGSIVSIWVGSLVVIARRPGPMA